MSNTSTLENNTSTCANCGKGEEASINLKACAACKLVKYCSRDCQAAHRPQHKKECKKRAKELHDEKLFEQPPPLEDCPICMIRLPTMESGRTYMCCCGKVICRGCTHAFQSRSKGHPLCPFCRVPNPANNVEVINRLEKRIEVNDAWAMYNMGCNFANGADRLPQNMAKALELWHQAANLGSAGAYYGIGNAYARGVGVERDKKKAKYYWELAATRGNVESRHNLGCEEGNLGNRNWALKHFMIAIEGGCVHSLKKVHDLYSWGYATKDEYAKALRSSQAYLDEIKSEQRDEAAAYRDDYKYYESGF